ncbi:MAG: hypothetical protein Kow0080_34110 [Candidatus Promineifilaceae bacterium]
MGAASKLRELTQILALIRVKLVQKSITPRPFLKSRYFVWYGLFWVLLAGCQQTAVSTATATPFPTATATPLPDAYIQDNTLFLHGTAVDTCTHSDCHLAYLRWSPDGRFLLYYKQQAGIGEYRLVNQTGAVQTVTINVNQPRPAAWSPDGQTILFLRQVNPFLGVAETESGEMVFGVWLVDVAPDGLLTTPVANGELSVPEAECPADAAAWAFTLTWDEADVLHFSLKCDGSGNGRYTLPKNNN